MVTRQETVSHKSTVNSGKWSQDSGHRTRKCSQGSTGEIGQDYVYKTVNSGKWSQDRGHRIGQWSQASKVETGQDNCYSIGQFT